MDAAVELLEEPEMLWNQTIRFWFLGFQQLLVPCAHSYSRDNRKELMVIIRLISLELESFSI